MDEPGPEPATASPSIHERAEDLLREPTLWPVWLVVIGHALVLLASSLLLAVRDGRASAALAVAIVAVATLRGLYGQLRTHRRLGPLHGTILVTWVLSIGLAIGADHWGIF
jgi:hypothetical protein